MLIRFFYNLALLALMFIFFPKMLWQFLVHGKYRKSFWSRIQSGKKFNPKGTPVIWFHAVSVGESKALSTLTPHIRKNHPDAFILVTTVTETGQNEAKRSIPDADAFCYLPLDFSWIIRRFVKELKPDLLVLVEGDFWHNLLVEVKSQGGKIALVNGKISETSKKRYLYFKTFASAIFDTIDLFCVQSEEYMKRFLELGISPEKIEVSHNLKFDIPSPKLEEQNFKEKLSISPDDFVITIGSTHQNEEKLILNALLPLQKKFKQLKLLLVPRYPERFRQVEQLIVEGKYPYIKLSDPQNQTGNEKVILIDQMGVLPNCYSISHLSIVGGSFIQGIGGHDIFEPAKMGTPVLYGPYMHTQRELTEVLSQAGVGKQLEVNELTSILETYLSNPELLKSEGEKGKALAQKMAGASFRTWKLLAPMLQS